MKHSISAFTILIAIQCWLSPVLGQSQAVKSNLPQRRIISLNGTWEIAKTAKSADVPTSFISKIPVPGLVDMASPAIDEPYTGALDKDKGPYSSYGNSSYMYNDAVYWYKRTFNLENTSAEVIQLKLNKSMYHTRIYLNGKLAGENYYNFTPTVVNIKPYLNVAGKPNELIIAVGSRNNLPDTIARGDDAEKALFAAGIYDDVKVILSGLPYISNVQTAPNLQSQRLRVVAEIQNDKVGEAVSLSYIVRELVSKKVIAQGVAPKVSSKANGQTKVDFNIAMLNAKLWSPESPFLYTLELSTGADKYETRFGMRSFKSGGKTGVVLLNNKPYYLRGTNLAIFRFFEDSERGYLPWDMKWVTKMHKRFKELHWNSFRNTLGFPPERWYDVADSLGFLVQDEYPIWKQVVPKALTSDHLAREYTQWMRERWNHPSVVIWDAQNESVYDSTTTAINKVRALDLSNRPWDNGWTRPASEGDVMESHPYLFFKYMDAFGKNPNFDISNVNIWDIFSKPMTPGNAWTNKKKEWATKETNYPNIINEYGWVWLNRDGSPTTLSAALFKGLFPEADTPEKRFEIAAKIIGAKTEYWRAHRRAAGVQHFSALSYSRTNFPKGQTSDNWIDVKNLVFEPFYYAYMKSAFSPVGIMLDFWKNRVTAGNEQTFSIIAINDTYKTWTGNIKLSISSEGKVVTTKTVAATVPPVGKKTYSSTFKFPTAKGKYQVLAEIIYNNESVKSTRDFVVE